MRRARMALAAILCGCRVREAGHWNNVHRRVEVRQGVLSAVRAVPLVRWRIGGGRWLCALRVVRRLWRQPCEPGTRGCTGAGHRRQRSWTCHGGWARAPCSGEQMDRPRTSRWLAARTSPRRVFVLMFGQRVKRPRRHVCACVRHACACGWTHFLPSPYEWAGGSVTRWLAGVSQPRRARCWRWMARGPR